MKSFIVAVMAAAALSLPAAVLAEEGHIAPPLGPGEAQSLGLSPQQQQAMMQVMMSAHAKMKQLHAQARNQVLAVLTPQQRSLLAQVVGNLAIAPSPDPDAAALQLQAALSPAQSERILALHSALEQQAHQIMSTAMSQTQALLTPEQRQKLHQGMPGHMGVMHLRHELGGPGAEAGHILLFMSMPMHFGMGMHAMHEGP